MKNHCVSLELAKRLVKAGWKKGTKFYWHHYKAINATTLKVIADEWKICLAGKYPAPLATEILEEIKPSCFFTCWYMEKSKKWRVGYPLIKNQKFDGDTLPDALARLWLYLREKKEV